MENKIKVQVTHRFKASAARVYDSWLDPQKVCVWLEMALKGMGLSGKIGRVEIDPKVGGAFLFSDIRDGAETRHWGTYLELDRPHKIVFTWILDKSEEDDPARVELTFQPEDEGCTATLVHEMAARWADYRAQTQIGWSCMLKATDDCLADGA